MYSSLNVFQYKTIDTGEQYLQVRMSSVVGISGNDTGLGLFTLKAIPQGQFITSYAPLAPVRRGHNYDSTDYIIKTVIDGAEAEIDGKLCPLGLGRVIQDGTFPLFLAPEKFSALVKSRVNCEWARRDGDVWFRSTRPILSGEELFTRYTKDNSYWTNQFNQNQLGLLRQALLAATNGTLPEAERILRNFSFTSL